MMRRFLIQITVTLAMLSTPLAAQVSLPGVRLPNPSGTVGGITGQADDTLQDVERSVRREAMQMLRARDRNLRGILRRNRDTIEADAAGNLAKRGELLALDLESGNLERLRDAGFTILSTEIIDGIGLSITRLGVPNGQSLASAESLANRLAPSVEFSADNLHFQSGSVAGPTGTTPITRLSQNANRHRIEVGIIDGAVGPSVSVVESRGFARGAPVPSNHGSAIASLLLNAGVTRIRVADVYGTDPAGGNALAITRGLGWLVASGSKIITISLVGPRNSVIERAIGAARREGVVVVAAVGNDGPAAPPAYPASYAGVIAITGVDGRGRALIEAGRALNLDYAAPGADIYALNSNGRRVKLRGTSFAVPLAAARLAAALELSNDWRSRLDLEAQDIGRRGPDPTFGRGLLCGSCAQR